MEAGRQVRHSGRLYNNNKNDFICGEAQALRPALPPDHIQRFTILHINNFTIWGNKITFYSGKQNKGPSLRSIKRLRENPDKTLNQDGGLWPRHEVHEEHWGYITYYNENLYRDNDSGKIHKK